MIIFYVLGLLIILILFIKLKIDIYYELHSTQSFLKVKFLFLKSEYKGRIVLKSKKMETQNYSNNKKILKYQNQTEKEKYSKSSKTTKNSKNKFALSILSYIFKDKTCKGIIKSLKKFRFEELSIYENIGLIDISATAIFVPIATLVTLLPLNVLDVNYNKFTYKITPIYEELKLDLIIDTKISFRTFDIILSIINEFLHKLFLNKEVDLK